MKPLPPAETLTSDRPKIDRLGRQQIVPSPSARLHRRLTKTSGGCLEWTGFRNPAGYGQIGVDGVLVLTHRLAYALAVGSWPAEGDLICHRCDNPPCCNPEHLFPGSHRDNVQDMMAKGRHKARVNEGNGRTTIPTSDVEAMRESAAAGESFKSIARRYGVHPVTVSRICRRLRRVS